MIGTFAAQYSRAKEDPGTNRSNMLHVQGQRMNGRGMYLDRALYFAIASGGPERRGDIKPAPVFGSAWRREWEKWRSANGM
jgi:hypothetical protein